MGVQLSTNLKQRLVFSALLTFGLLTAIYFSSTAIGGAIFFIFMALIAGRALYEYCEMLRQLELSPPTSLALIWHSLFIASLYGQYWWNTSSSLPPAIAIGGVVCLFFNYFAGGVKPLLNIAATLLGFVYITLAFSTIFLIYSFFPLNYPEDVRYWILFALAVPKFTDVAGYMIGRPFGKHPLAARISPKKTIEGALGGLIAGCLTAVAIWAIAHAFNDAFSMSILEAIFLGALLSIAGQFGDLTESLLKRDAKVKDSSHIPGVGGVFDVIDSLLLSGPALYLYLLIR